MFSSNDRWDVFDVYLKEKLIDTVTYLASQKMTIEKVERSLINHDGYDPMINVVKRRKKR